MSDPLTYGAGLAVRSYPQRLAQVAEILGTAHRDHRETKKIPRDIVLDMTTRRTWIIQGPPPPYESHNPRLPAYSTHPAIRDPAISDPDLTQNLGGFLVPADPTSFFTPGRVYAELSRGDQERTTQGAGFAPDDQTRYMVVIRQEQGNGYAAIPILIDKPCIHNSQREADHPGGRMQVGRLIRVVTLSGPRIDVKSLDLNHLYAYRMSEYGPKVMEIGQIGEADIKFLQGEFDEIWEKQRHPGASTAGVGEDSSGKGY